MREGIAGTVVELLPRALYRVELQASASSRRRIVAHAVRGAAQNFVRLVVGDRVLVTVSDRDPGRGRIVRKLD